MKLNKIIFGTSARSVKVHFKTREYPVFYDKICRKPSSPELIIELFKKSINTL